MNKWYSYCSYSYCKINCSRWKSFAVAELNLNSLENIRSWMVVLHGKAYCTGYFTFHWKSFAVYRLIRENHETFPPRTICNTQYIPINSTNLSFPRKSYIPLQWQICKCDLGWFSLSHVIIITCGWWHSQIIIMLYESGLTTTSVIWVSVLIYWSM